MASSYESEKLTVMLQLLRRYTGRLSVRIDRHLCTQGEGGTGVTYSYLVVDFRNGERLILPEGQNQIIFQAKLV